MTTSFCPNPPLSQLSATTRPGSSSVSQIDAEPGTSKLAAVVPTASRLTDSSAPVKKGRLISAGQQELHVRRTPPQKPARMSASPTVVYESKQHSEQGVTIGECKLGVKKSAAAVEVMPILDTEGDALAELLAQMGVTGGQGEKSPQP